MDTESKDCGLYGGRQELQQGKKYTQYSVWIFARTGRELKLSLRRMYSQSSLAFRGFLLLGFKNSRGRPSNENITQTLQWIGVSALSDNSNRCLSHAALCSRGCRKRSISTSQSFSKAKTGLNNNKTLFFGGRGETVDYSRIFTFHGGFET